jgi:hypothetical protein
MEIKKAPEFAALRLFALCVKKPALGGHQGMEKRKTPRS